MPCLTLLDRVESPSDGFSRYLFRGDAEGQDNPYRPGHRESLANSGLYCEAVIKANQPLHVANALAASEWRNNPDVALNMISYLGFPSCSLMASLSARSASWIRRRLTIRKRIKDGQGKWCELERYISEHSEAKLSHGLCPECLRANYGEVLDEKGDAGTKG